MIYDPRADAVSSFQSKNIPSVNLEVQRFRGVHRTLTATERRRFDVVSRIVHQRIRAVNFSMS
jgi:hypothetical protein